MGQQDAGELIQKILERLTNTDIQKSIAHGLTFEANQQQPLTELSELHAARIHSHLIVPAQFKGKKVQEVVSVINLPIDLPYQSLHCCFKHFFDTLTYELSSEQQAPAYKINHLENLRHYLIVHLKRNVQLFNSDRSSLKTVK